MAKIVKKLKKVSRGLKSISGRAKTALRKAGAPVRKKRPVAEHSISVSSAAIPRRGRRRKDALPLSNVLTAVQAKYFTHPENRIAPSLRPHEPARRYLEEENIPDKYERDMIVLQVRDPWWLHAYWEVCQKTCQRLKNELARFFDTARKILRVYDVSFINFNGSNAHRYFDIEISHNANSWYIDTSSPGRSWCVDLGLKLSDGRFITIVRSNIVTTPLDGPSWITDEEWAVPEELFSKLYASAVGLGGSPVKLKKPWLELQRRSQASGGVSSLGFSPVRKEEKRPRKFWLVVNTELIVYGATESDAKVTVAGRAVTLRPDGTFSLRFSLPDGKQVIPVRAASCDGVDERIITPVVNKETR